MRAIILAAGRGSRMGSLTEDAPKCLVPFRGRALLEWQIEALARQNISEIAIITGYKREALQRYGLVEFHNPRWFETNMVYSLAQAAEWLLAGSCVVSYSDLYYTADALKPLVSCVAPLAIAYDPNWLSLWRARFEDPLDDAESFRLGKNGEVLEIGGKPRSQEEIEGQYMGLLRFSPVAWQETVRIVDQLPEEQRDGVHMTATLQRIIQAGRVHVTAVPYLGEWYEFDAASDLSVTRGSI